MSKEFEDEWRELQLEFDELFLGESKKENNLLAEAIKEMDKEKFDSHVTEAENLAEEWGKTFRMNRFFPTPDGKSAYLAVLPNEVVNFVTAILVLKAAAATAAIAAREKEKNVD